jgi:hypothetical protein
MNGMSEESARVAASEDETKDARIAELEAALFAVRDEICTGPIDDTLWHKAIPAETTVDYICNTLRDDWDYDDWLAAAALKAKP